MLTARLHWPALQPTVAMRRGKETTRPIATKHDTRETPTRSDHADTALIPPHWKQ